MDWTRNPSKAACSTTLFKVDCCQFCTVLESVRNGHIKRITDEDIQSSVIELLGNNVSTTYVTCPLDPKKTLGIKLPYFVMTVKNMKKYFTFEVQVLDDKGMKRRFRASNFQSTTRVKPFICTMPLRLDEGWNQVQFNLADFVKRAYGSTYVETLRIQIHANCRLRRVYFADRLYTEEELPAEFKLYLPGLHSLLDLMRIKLCGYSPFVFGDQSRLDR
uniref:DUF667 domain-containing protein n=1 Tax=Globodera pallida TaxID=36090 RepID=A0A183BMR6_GLOPA